MADQGPDNLSKLREHRHAHKLPRQNGTGETITSRQNKWIAQAFLKLREAYGGKCSNPDCGSVERLEFAHVRPTELRGWGRGRKERYHDIKNNPECYILLCHDCHRDMDDELDAQEKSNAPVETG